MEVEGAAVDGDLVGASGRHGAASSRRHQLQVTRPRRRAVASTAVRLEDFDYPLPPEAIAQQPDRAPRRGPPAGRRRPGSPRRPSPRARPARSCCGRRSARRQRLPGHPGPAPPAPGDRRRRRGAAARSRSTTSTAAGSAWPVRPAAWRRVSRCSAPTGSPVLVVGPRTEAGDTLTVELCANDPVAVLAAIGEVPLPPYITTPLADPERYQTVYARAARLGGRADRRAAPHGDLLAALGRAEVWPWPGSSSSSGSTRSSPSPSEDPTRHRIHSERYRVPARDARSVPQRDERVVAVGTTTVRALESAAVGPAAGRTRLFIRRPYQWQLVDLLLTNFHLPRTTLLMMIDAFVGPRWRDLYAVALGRRVPVPVLRRRHAAAAGRRDDRPVDFEVDGRRRSRRGRASPTPRAGSYRTPCFMPVGHPGRGASTCRPPTTTSSAPRSCSATPTT